jgi:multiple sugar transport system substrate-binding protein
LEHVAVRRNAPKRAEAAGSHRPDTREYQDDIVSEQAVRLVTDSCPSPARRALLASGLLGALPIPAAPATVLTVATWTGLDVGAKALLPLWRQRHPEVDIRLFSREYGDHHTFVTTALSTSGEMPDVVAVAADFVGRYARGNGLEDLAREPYRIDRLRSRLVPYAYDQAATRAGAVVAMPVDIGPGTLLYRADILARAGVAEAELTRSWQSYLQAGVRIKAATGAYLVAAAGQVADIVIRTGLLPGEGFYFDQDSRVLVTSDRFMRAFEIARRVRQYKLDARVKPWSNEWVEGFKRGSLATELSGAWLVGALNNWVAPQTHGLWRAAPLPDGAQAAFGGAFYAMPRLATASRKALAWEFIQLLSLDLGLQLQAFKSYDAFPSLLQAHDDPFFEQPMAFLGGQPARQVWRAAARRIGATPVHKQDGFAAEVVATELDKVLNSGKDIRVALSYAQRLLERRAHR